jgi:ketosteroid isomerase-like protein
MHPNAALIERFYTAFQARDAEGMRSVYADDNVFSDPVFGELHGPQVGAMWAMLCGRSKDLSLNFTGVQADDERGRARWDARYTFTQTGRKVHNIIHAHFEFRDGRIVRHRDSFSFWRWARQALGPAGLLLGWTPVIRARVRLKACDSLTTYMQKKAAPPA